MTEVLAVKTVEDCFDADLVREVELASPMSERLMRLLAAGGELDFHPEFPRPYYRIDLSGAYVLQGSLGSQVIRVTLARGKSAEALQQLVHLLNEGG